ncbi:hypothetical protein M0805_003661 [Coniferiporia weirii]|nr:hypothetical protein M0805_003661 [Coniferiporia weirii]
MLQPGNHSGADQEILYLKAVEIDFKDNESRRPIVVKLKLGEDERKSRRFRKDELVNWELGSYMRLSLPADLSISVEEVHKIKRNKDAATFELTLTSADVIGKDVFSADDTSGRARMKLTFVSPTDELAERLVQDAQTAVGNKKVLLESLGKAGKAISVLMKFTDLASDVHPAAKAAFLLVGVLYERFQAQQECHDEATALMKDVASLLPFIGDNEQAPATNARTRQTISEMLDLFCKISGLVIDYSGKGMPGDLFSSRKDELDLSKDELRRLRATYDWCVKTEIWKSVIETGMRTEDIQLQQLCAAKRAYYDIGKGCLEGTRVSVLEQIREWGASEAGPGLFWLHGMAGSGKSAIANSVARMFEEQQCLLGCFFCKKDEPECRVPMNVIPTLAMHFSKWHQTYRSMVASVIQGGDGPKLTQSLQWQFGLLMKDPLTSLSVEREDLPPRPLVIVVDALDECGDSVDLRSELAGFLAKVADLVPWLKVVITSRPLTEFQQVFRQPNSNYRVLNVNTGVAPEQVQADILQYTKHCAENLGLTEGQITNLALKASGLFIWTSTAFKFIKAQLDVRGAVVSLLKQTLEDNPEVELDKMYTTVLDGASIGHKNAQIIKAVIGVVVCTSKNRPLPASALLEFAIAIKSDIDLEIIEKAIDCLQAVLYKDTSKDGAIRVCHPSFLDFINTQTHSGSYWTDPGIIDYILAKRCLQIMSTQLKFNICDLKTSHLFNSCVPGLEVKIAEYLPQYLQYSCLYWMHHIITSEPNGGLSTLQEFLNNLFCGPKALYWLECLSIIKRLKSGIEILELFSRHYRSSDMHAIVACKDLYRLLTENYAAISTSTPHLYISALSWAPTESYVAKTLYAHFWNQPLIGIGKGKMWSPNLWTADVGSAVNCVAYSPDGRYIVSGSGDNTLRIWDAQIGNSVGDPLTGHSLGINSVAYSPDGRHIVSGSSDRTLRIWDTQTGSAVGEPLIGHSGAVRSVAYSPDGRHIVSGSDGSMLRIWDAQIGKPVGDPLKGHLGSVNSVAYSPDGRHIVSGSSDKTLRTWDAQTGSAVGKPLRGHSRSVWAVAYSPDGRHIVSGSYDNTVRTWNSQTGGTVGELLTDHSSQVRSIAYSPDGRHIVSSSDDKTLKIWDTLTGNPVGEPFSGHSDLVQSVAYSPDGRYIVSGSWDKTMRIWDSQTRSTVGEPQSGHSRSVNSVAYSPDGRHIVSGSSDCTLRIWDVQTGSGIGKPLRGHSKGVWAVVYSPDGKCIVSGSDDSTLRIWDSQTGSTIGEPLSGHSEQINSVAYSPDGRHIVSGSDDETLRIWDALTGSGIGKPLRGHSKGVWAVAYSPDGIHIVSGSADTTLRIWDSQTGSAVGEPLIGHSGAATSAAYSPDGRHIVSGSWDNTLRIWDAENGNPVKELLTGQSIGILCVAYSPDGRHIVSGSYDGTLKILDAQTGNPVGEPLRGHSGSVHTVAYSPDGRHIASGSWDKTLRVWGTDIVQAGFDVGASYSPNMIGADGWVRDLSGNLLLWVPYTYRSGIRDTSKTCIPALTDGECVRMNWGTLLEYSGSSWVNIMKQS